MLKSKIVIALLLAVGLQAHADTCKDLPSYEDLKKALIEARKADNGGLNFDMWGSLVDRSGIVCAVAHTGAGPGDQWLGSRVISAQKASTANSFSLPGFALSTANIYSITQPGAFAFGIQESNPVDVKVAYRGQFKTFGSKKDPMVGDRIGGINVFGGGLALYNAKGELIGGVGVSGDSSCADHLIAWRTRNNLKLDFVPGGPIGGTDQIAFDIKDGKSASGFGQPTCGGKEPGLVAGLPATSKVKK